MTCSSRPDVINNAVILNATRKDLFQLHDLVQYACVNETLKMVGNGSVSCLISGEWSTLPKCEAVKEVKNSGMNSLYIVLPIFFLPSLILIVLIVRFKCKNKYSADLPDELIPTEPLIIEVDGKNELPFSAKRRKESVERTGEFDAFVIYHFDTEHDYVVNSLIPELKDARHFRLHIDGIDFQPGRRIEEALENAIETSNSAIILLSVGFMQNKWCLNEFTHCYFEHVRDPSFKLFVIMMQDLKYLPDLPLYMKELLKEETYLDLNDPELFPKLARYLRPEDDTDVSDID